MRRARSRRETSAADLFDAIGRTSSRSESANATSSNASSSTLLDVLDSLRRGGYASDFFSASHGAVRCATCDALTDATRLKVQGLQRLDGVADPADGLVVVALACGACCARGTLVLGHGPIASAADAEVLSALLVSHRAS